ncbi:hypothetical protein BP6252_02749 [Coleophoma cylindrospora]|uniref:Ricin B lectin domain-containing protein n=1 Tax=Coleophoma cylindrospora TaxID=1849047 RepID=A0A3D8SFP2_9HELO|nr:hypothetical protein BP6252_02749 [Coleophoma cylindrospora]
MLSSTTLSAFLLSVSAFTAALPGLALEARTVTALNTAAFDEAQQRDATATRAFSSTTIKTSTGQCLSVDELSGDFRANLTPIQVKDCDGSTGQAWDIITKGKHDDQAGTMLIVNTLTQACMNFDPRRAAGNTVIMFSCGGRADGGGAVTNSQLFNFTGASGPLSFLPLNAVGTCLAVTSNNVLDQATCSTGAAGQTFTFGGSGASSAAATTTAAAGNASTIVAGAAASTSCGCVVTTMVTVTRQPGTSTTANAQAVSTTEAASTTATASTTAAASTAAAASPTVANAVSRAGGVLNPSAAAEANPRDNTATRAFSSVAIKSSSGECLTIDASAGDFRENLIPITLSACTGSAGQQFDLITAGQHNNIANSTLVVSTLTQGCVNFDPRRAAGDTVIMFSCGGRADGGGQVTNSQLFPFAGTAKSIVLAPENANGATCLVQSAAGKLDSAACSGGSEQVFTIG